MESLILQVIILLSKTCFFNDEKSNICIYVINSPFTSGVVDEVFVCQINYVASAIQVYV